MTRSIRSRSARSTAPPFPCHCLNAGLSGPVPVGRAGPGARVGQGVGSGVVVVDPEAVRAVYRAYGRLVYAVAYKLLGDQGLAEEAAQQTFVQAWRAAGSYDPVREVGPWLATIARRAAIDIHRREARGRHSSLDGADPADPALISLPPSAEQVYDVWEVRRAIDALDPQDAELVRLQHFEDLTHAQIAERLGIPVGTIK